jgi:dimethylargininase
MIRLAYDACVRIALTRAVSPNIAQCELSYIARQPIDADRAAAQHRDYERCLAAHGCAVIPIAPAPELPDGVFVEDCAVVLDELAILTRPGAESRQAETGSVAAALGFYRLVRAIESPATIDGGDVLRVGRKIYVGQSKRTSEDAILQLRWHVHEYGFRVIPVEFKGCLHLKSAATQIDDATLLLNPEWVAPEQFDECDIVAVDPSEPHAANALRVGDALLYSASHPATRRILEARGYHVDPIDLSELEKAEAGVTCCSLVFES